MQFSHVSEVRGVGLRRCRTCGNTSWRTLGRKAGGCAQDKLAHVDHRASVRHWYWPGATGQSMSPPSSQLSLHPLNIQYVNFDSGLPLAF